jgi:ABC-type oligopeptide transport system ATPase subunit
MVRIAKTTTLARRDIITKIGEMSKQGTINKMVKNSYLKIAKKLENKANKALIKRVHLEYVLETKQRFQGRSRMVARVETLFRQRTNLLEQLESLREIVDREEANPTLGFLNDPEHGINFLKDTEYVSELKKTPEYKDLHKVQKVKGPKANVTVTMFYRAKFEYWEWGFGGVKTTVFREKICDIEHKNAFPASYQPFKDQFFLTDRAAVDEFKGASNARLVSYAFERCEVQMGKGDLAAVHVPLRRTNVFASKVIDYCHIHADDLNIPPTDINCAIWGMYTVLHPYIPTMTLNSLEELIQAECVHAKANREHTCPKDVDCEHKKCKCQEGIIDWDHMCHVFCHYKVSHHLFDVRNSKKHFEVFPRSNYPSFCAYVIDNHLYIVKDPKKIKSICQNTANKKNISRKDFDFECPLNGKIIVDFVSKCENKMDEFKELLRLFNSSKDTVFCVNTKSLTDFMIFTFTQGVSLKNRYSNGCIERLYHKNNGCLILANPNKVFGVTHKTTIGVLKKLNIEFNNQSISAIAWGLLEKVYNIRSARKCLSSNNKKKLIETQKGKCNMCKEALESNEIEFDHIIRCTQGGDGKNIANFQALCTTCHASKTSKETSDKFFEQHPLQSFFNDVTMEIFGAKTSAFVDGVGFSSEDKGIACSDRIKSRRSIIQFNKFDYPIYTTLDVPAASNVKSITDIRCGFFYVETTDITLYKGTNWYSAPRVIKGLENNIIRIDDIKFELLPSSIIPANYFVKFIESIKEVQVEGDGLDTVWKALPNTLIGCMGATVSKNGKMTLSNNKNSIAYDAFEYGARVSNTFFDSNSGEFMQTNGIFGKNDEFVNDDKREVASVYTIIFNYKEDKKDGMVPIYSQILDMECCEMFELAKQIKTVENDMEIVFRATDCVYFKLPTRVSVSKIVSQFVPITKFFLSINNDNDDEVTESFEMVDVKPEVIAEKMNKIEKHLQSIRYPDGSRKYKDLERSFDHGKNPIECKVRTSPYAHQDKYANIVKSDWKVIQDPGKITDMFALFATEMVNLKSSFLIEGRAGCGKTTLAREIIKQLKALKKNVVVLAPTRKAMRVINGDNTLTSFFIKNDHNKKTAADVIFVDEVSMMKEIYYRFFQSLKAANPELILIFSGDFKQFLPVKDLQSYDYQNSYLLNKLVDATKIQLTEFRRGAADKKGKLLFDLCLEENLRTQSYSKLFPSAAHEFGLTFLNRDRININDDWMKRIQKKNKAKFVVVPKTKENSQSQDTLLMNRLPIIATKNVASLNIINSVEYIVISWDQSGDYFIITEKDNDIKDQTLYVTIKGISNLTKYFHPGFCISLTKAQGITINRPYTIYGWNIMDCRQKYVALSRSSKYEYVFIKDLERPDMVQEEQYDDADFLDADFDDLYD